MVETCVEVNPQGYGPHITFFTTVLPKVLANPQNKGIASV
jgi:hypothetical protein